jgi:heterotetrameric sarcosine oxidase gamma subunit
MTRPENAIVTNHQALTLAKPEASSLIRFEIWSDPIKCQARLAKALGTDLPLTGKSKDAGSLRLVWLEPLTWLVRAPEAEGAKTLAAIEKALNQDGGACDISGALVRTRVTGTAWRMLLTINGVFDAESEAFGPGCMAATVIAHAPVRIDVISDTVFDAYTPPSYAPDLFQFWDHAAARLNLQAEAV